MKLISILFKLLIAVGIFWLLLTLWVQYFGKQEKVNILSKNATHSALIVYSPDPIYDLDKQVAKSIANGLASKHFNVNIRTNKRVENALTDYDLVVLISNTYNWEPDWGISRFVKYNQWPDSLNVAAITLGSGSTKKSHEIFTNRVKATGSNLLSDSNWWLLRPNDDNRTNEKNVDVAKHQAALYGIKLAEQVQTKK